MSASTIRSEVRGLDVVLDESSLAITHSGDFLAGPVILTPQEADRLRLEMAKAQLVQEGFEKQAPITVLRNGQTIQLPLPGHNGPNLSKGETAADVQQPANPPGDSIEDQLNRIKASGR